ncbi:MBL fold metallo-hydrolase [Wenzhouxiangella sp. XN201]|uniref:MBL fold metallo-hydrolase n=1 Tax=Wenzhouxiangella sp. XN201 TaxID=2710755 RepID=UPI0013C9AD6E|nr:MBL fold metallo-hydrolase [Wenzhouxiangella sp. XN201]NEZ02989.1 MBL fold metallo-hydrolase [Wenzhouxiangella sp. XN201]
MASIETPIMQPLRAIAGDWKLLPSFMPVPGMGALAVNSLVLNCSEPLLVDTGLAALRDDWLERLGEVVDPVDLKWIWISHADADHVGNLAALLEVAPSAKVLTSFLGMGKLAMAGIRPERMQIVEPGGLLEIGGRRLLPIRPPYYDAPETLGLFDPGDGLLFTADCYGALLPGPVERAEDAGVQALREGMVQWSAVDSPWLGQVDRDGLGATLKAFGALAPQCVVSSHLPPVAGGLETLSPIIFNAWCRNGGGPADTFHVEAVADVLHAAA